MNERKYAEGGLSHIAAGASIQRVPCLTSKTPDLLMNFKNVKYLIEEKEKNYTPKHLERRSADLDAGKVHANAVPLARDNTLSGLVRDAERQLSSFASEPVDFRLVWLTATGTRAEGKYYQLIATPYGTTRILDINDTDLRVSYFFKNSEFYRYSATLDGAVVAYVYGSELKARLCINPLSTRYDAFKRSPLTHAFGTAITDPLVEESDGIACILDSDIDRKNEDGLLSYLRTKYRTGPLQTLGIGFLSAEVSVRASYKTGDLE